MTTNPPAPEKKPNLGRQKIEIKKIEKESNRLVAFSKRRQGLFKKASELCTVTGAEIAIIVKSAGKRVYNFAQPNLETITDRFISENTDDDDNGEVVENNTQTTEHYLQLHRELEAEKKLSRVIEAARIIESGRPLGDDELDELDIEVLEKYAAELDDMKKSIPEKRRSLHWKISTPMIIPKVEQC